jgi:hypothetical protein
MVVNCIKHVNDRLRFRPLRPALVLTLPIATPSCPLAKKEAQSTSKYSRVTTERRSTSHFYKMWKLVYLMVVEEKYIH